MPEERSVRDRLAEAMWLKGFREAAAPFVPMPKWPDIEPWAVELMLAEADRLLVALPGVGLQLVPLSPHQAGDSER